MEAKKACRCFHYLSYCLWECCLWTHVSLWEVYLFLPWKADDFDFGEHHLRAQVLCFVCYCFKVVYFHPWLGKIKQHCQYKYAFFLHPQTITYFHICACSSINRTLWHFILVSPLLEKTILLKVCSGSQCSLEAAALGTAAQAAQHCSNAQNSTASL